MIVRALVPTRNWAASGILVLAIFGFTPGPLLAQRSRTPGSFTANLEAPGAHAAPDRSVPPRAKQALKFLAERGLMPGHSGTRSPGRTQFNVAIPRSAGTAKWQPAGPAAVNSQGFGLVTGRIAALALDPSDPTGNRLYAGTTGGGVWFSQDSSAASPATIEFVPLTDNLAALDGIIPASISIGALTVQPGGTGVILAGTGDPNDALDSYYGGGILRSTDSGKSWSLITRSLDVAASDGQPYRFAGEAFAGFAWSTANPELVVAAVSQAFESELVNAESPLSSYQGLYYSTDSGATWRLATINDGAGSTVQGPSAVFAKPNGNGAVAVVWNPVRKLFIAAVRFHGYYQSADGETWIRMAAQPGLGLTTAFCPTNPGFTGSPDCPIFRGSLAVNPQTGDTFAWTVDENNQDQGLWQDKCTIRGGSCSNQTIAFAQRWNTAPLEADTLQGPATIVNGDYDLVLAAVPFEQDTLLLAGDDDLWKCSLAAGCVWRNTTHANTCMSAKVAAYQHAIAWNPANPLEVFIGNDGGLWRSTDAVNEGGPACSADDAGHYQNLNGGLGSLAEVMSVAVAGASQYTMMAGLGVSGTAGVKSNARVADWPEIENGEGGPTAIDPMNNLSWYVNSEAGVSIHRCSQTAGCTPSAFGVNPVVDDADVDGDGLAMTAPAPFLVDPADHTNLLIGTCRVWRGPASGVGWSTSNAVSPILDGNQDSVSCQGDPLIRSIAALQTPDGEAIYVGMYGPLDGGSTLAGHIFGAKIKPAGNSAPLWQDLTLNPVANDAQPLNLFGYDISSIFVDPHDSTGNTVYVTVQGFFSRSAPFDPVARSTDGGVHWQDITANLPPVPVSSLVVDPEDANTVYVATDNGVFSTRQVANCATPASSCWTAFGSGLPQSPVVALALPPIGSSIRVLTAGTYGRGIWQNPLWTAGIQLTTATVKPSSLNFAAQPYGTTSAAQAIRLTNSGTIALTPTIVMNGDFLETDNCQTAAVNAGAECTIQVKFAPTATGARPGTMTIEANVPGGQILIPLSGTGTAGSAFSLMPTAVDFGQVPVGSSSAPYEVTANNNGQAAVTVSAAGATLPFAIDSNACGGSIPAKSACQIRIVFSPKAPGAAHGTFTIADSAGTQTVQLIGEGAAKASDTLSATSLTLPATILGQLSAAQSVVVTNGGDLPLTSIATKVNGPFQAGGNCGAILPGHSSCAIGVKFAPTAAGRQTGTLTISDVLRTQTVQLAGVGEEAPKFTLSPTQLSFTPEPVGKASAPMALSITNSGGAPMTNVAFHTSGNAPSSFLVSSTTCGALLNAGSSCMAQVKFIPAETGGNAAALTVSSSTIGAYAASLPLSGIGLPPPELAVSPPSISFGDVAVAGRSTVRTVTIANSGGAPMNDMRLAIRGNFTFSTGSCTAELAVGRKCAVQVTFAPAAAGVLQGQLAISSASGSATPATVSLSGSGIGPATVVTSSSNLDFGEVPAGQTSAPRQLTVTDSGTGGLNGMALAIRGAFALRQNRCASALAPEKSCSTMVVFLPKASGAQTGTLTVSSTTKWASPAVVSLSGTGIAEPLLAASAPSLAFGSVPIGNRSIPLSLKVSNPGTGAVEGLTIQPSGDFALAKNGCGKTLPVSGVCTTTVVFSPAESGNRTGSLIISGTSPGLKSVTVRLTGTGLAPGSLAPNVSNLVFGNETVGRSTQPQLATITNTSAGTASGLAFKATGDFAIQDNTCGATLGGGASCTMDVVFAPKSSTLRTGTLTAGSTTTGVGSATIALSGTGIPAAYITAAPARLVFSLTTVGSPSAPMAVTLSNPGIAETDGLKAAAMGDFSATLCATKLPAGGNCRMGVVFKPTGVGVRAGQLTLSTAAANAAPVAISLVGTGAAPPFITANPPLLNFPGTTPGQTSPAQAVVVTNSGDAALNTPGLAISGDFHIAANRCTAALPAGGKCRVDIEFSPTAIGGRTGTLTFASTSNGVQPATVNLAGIGLTPAVIGVSPAQLTFPTVLTGQSSTPQTVTVSNAGASAIAALKLGVSQQFALTANTCKASLAVGAKCTVEVYFKPVAEGPVTGGLTVTSPSAAVPANVALSGAGGAPAALVLQPGVLNFPTTGVGIASSPLTVTVTNQSSAGSLTGLELKIGSGFRLVNNRCTSALGPSASCTTGIEFNPTSAGLQQATLDVTTQAGASGRATLQGTGFDFTVTLNGADSLTVASGQTASYTLSIAPLNGSEGTFTFSCGTLPANSQCIFNPATESLGAGTTGTVAVRVATGQSSPAASVPVRSEEHLSRAWLIVFGAVLVPFAARRRSRNVTLFLLFAISIAAVTSCVGASGGSSGGPRPTQPGVTPPATYLIPVSVLADGLEHKATVTLTVD